MSRLVARHMPGCEQMYWSAASKAQSDATAGHERMHGDCHDARHLLVLIARHPASGGLVIGT